MLFRHDRAAAASIGAATIAGSEAGDGERSDAATGAFTPNGVVVERPPPGLARGKYPTSPLVIGALGAALIVIALLYTFFRLRNPRS